MARVTVPSKKPTAAQKRAQAALEASSAVTAQARRGEDDDLVSAAEAAVSAPAEEPQAAVPHQAESAVHVPHQDDVVKASERDDASFEFVKPPQDLDALEQVGMARRGIAQANRALENGLGRLQRGYVTSAGEYLWWVTQGTRLKAAGFKSVAKFAEPLGLTTQDVYRLRRAVPVHRIIGDMIEGALNERTYRELYSTIVDEKGEIPVTADGEPNVSPERQQLLRDQFAEMKRMGKITSAGAVAARRVLMLGRDTEAIEPEPGADSGPGAADQLAKARRTNRILPLEVLRDAKEKDPEAVQQYVEDLKRAYEAAAEIVG
ncbi:hypothetical protein QFZ75_007911 [Streptomyces sp. V3I8]|uniref:hypothetical protein n=1 Tax=Streptomyces sp. V3I8 TaxID=3042279 RepID=UPI00278B9EFC|nr:hypothetical protein [Streptomyces sp. V3I8]MDQ1041409.1 hypothetical protein [Streptomyces sp. V3I8]